MLRIALVVIAAAVLTVAAGARFAPSQARSHVLLRDPHGVWYVAQSAGWVAWSNGFGVNLRRVAGGAVVHTSVDDPYGSLAVAGSRALWSTSSGTGETAEDTVETRAAGALKPDGLWYGAWDINGNIGDDVLDGLAAGGGSLVYSVVGRPTAH